MRGAPQLHEVEGLVRNERRRECCHTLCPHWERKRSALEFHAVELVQQVWEMTCNARHVVDSQHIRGGRRSVDLSNSLCKRYFKFCPLIIRNLGADAKPVRVARQDSFFRVRLVDLAHEIWLPQIRLVGGFELPDGWHAEISGKVAI